jgi:hypothetical protein
MNIFQRIGAALGRQIDREHDATSLNTAVSMAPVAAIRSVHAEPDWEAIAEELMGALYAAHKCEYRDGGAACLACAAITRYEAAKQVKP